jgi:glycosyltransferase involved in cell wall biosynthesis
MIVGLVSEQRLLRTPDGAVWSESGPTAAFFRRYLDVFSEVRVVARVREIDSAEAGLRRIDGDGVSVSSIPYYLGPWQFVRIMHRVRSAVRKSLPPQSAVILRVPSTLGNTVAPVLQANGRPYGVEVVGDPWDVFSAGTIRHPLRPFFRWWFPRAQRKQCASACACAYVTENALQRRYPGKPGAFSTHYSSIEMPRAAIVDSPRRFVGGDSQATRLVFVGSLSQLYKGPDVLLRAIADCARSGTRFHAVIIGDGRYRQQLEAETQALGLTRQVSFTGEIPGGEPVYRELDKADLFVLPTRTEGLPRALIEAMARGLPCVASSVGGIPELLAPEDMVPPGDVGTLAAKLCEVTVNPKRMNEMSKRNLERARCYSEDVLRQRRISLYRYIKKATEAWLLEVGGTSGP